MNNKIILITQYYKVKSDDKKYKNERQKEIDYCLQKNFDNKYINEIHFILEEDYDIEFIKNKNNIKIIKNISGTRINFKDVFVYCNNILENNICILINSDIYLNDSIEVVKNINFKINKIFIALNRYENDSEYLPPLIHGLEIDDATYKNCESFLKPYQPTIWSQDVWIWKGKIENIDERFNFNLGVKGCDNYISYLMKDIGYNLLNCSSIICANHYDKLSIKNTEYGISKGNISSNKKNNKIGDLNTYLFLENQDDIPDKYTIKMENKLVDNDVVKINYLSIEKNISEVTYNNSQIVSSSFLNKNHNPEKVSFDSDSCWIPNIDDMDSFIQFNFDNIFDIAVINISGKPLTKDDYYCGYITKFKISYIYKQKILIDENIYSGIEINNGNYIKKIYLKNIIKCTSIQIHPIEYVNFPALKIKFFKIHYQKKDIFNFMINNTERYKNFDETNIDYEIINNTSYINYDFNYDSNIFDKNILKGICIYTYVMNRDNNIYNNIKSWLKQSIDQLIILDWNSKTNFSDYLNSLNDSGNLF